MITKRSARRQEFNQCGEGLLKHSCESSCAFLVGSRRATFAAPFYLRGDR